MALPGIDPALIARVLHIQERLKEPLVEEDMCGIVGESVLSLPGTGGCAVCMEGKVIFAASIGGVGDVTCFPGEGCGDGMFAGCPGGCPLQGGLHLRRFPFLGPGCEFGALLVRVNDEKSFDLCESLVKVLVDHLALRLESRRRVQRLQEVNASLEKKLREAETALRKSEKKYDFLFEEIGVGIGISDTSGKALSANRAMARITGYTLEEFLGLNVRTFYVDPAEGEKLRGLIARHGKVENFETRLRRKNGEIYWASLTVTPIEYDGKGAYLTSLVDVTERKNAEEALRDSETRYRTLFETANDAIFLMDENTFIECNEATIEIFGCSSKGDILGHPPWEFSPARQPDGQLSKKKAMSLIRRALAGEPQRFYWKHSRKDGTLFDAEVSLNSIMIQDRNYLQAIVRDITERVRAEEERMRLEQQFHQMQKLESIGRLAGGVAHDYNNMLNVIIGYAELALKKLEPSEPLYEDLEEILKAARRSSDVTRQLLAFASKQTVVPRVLDLNATVEGMLNMLRRLIGENIELVWRPADRLWLVKIDPSQVDQILANLCINARDAISSTGRIVIETKNTVVDGSELQRKTGVITGDYVVLSITDDGCGMDRETMERLFEPFFTTKKVGEGTGLGLSTVYGIVRQSRGFIDVESSPGRGTSFKIYLPRYLGEGLGREEDEKVDVPKGNGEVVLLVEDEVSILKLAERILVGLGYRVLSARSPHDAVELAEKHHEEIALLVTDVVMPEMNGRDLAEKVRDLNPAIRCLYMSGYTADAIVHRGVLEGGAHFIQKPFSMRELALKVARALGE